MEKFGWLLGKWENKIDEGLLIESWEKENDSVISGKSYLAKKDDTLFFESIELKIMDGNFYYVPTVKNQNDNKPVYFKLVSEVNNEFIFEDKEHDFPQRVIYNNLSKDSLSARIEGMQEGQFRKEEFAFRRSNN